MLDAAGAGEPRVEEVEVAPTDPQRLAELIGAERLAAFGELAERLRRRLADRCVWQVNSTARGGGVAEMLRSHLAYVRGAGVDARWLVIPGSLAFFSLTKRIHHALHGSPGDGGPLGDRERRLYEETLHTALPGIVARLGARDVIVLHDPQTAGLIPELARLGHPVIWRCHVGSERTSSEIDRAWDFLAPYVSRARACVFTRASYIPACCDGKRGAVISPAIDPLSPKNQELAPDVVRAILAHVGILAGPAPATPPVFRRSDGSPRRVDRCADIRRGGPAPAWEDPVITQVSRWDPLKDPVGVLRGFERLLEMGAPPEAHLVLAGPSVRAVADDPEAVATYEGVEAVWRSLPFAVRRRSSLVSLPLVDVEENAAIVNALQRHATVVVQKSLEEGFGLTVSEAMWKARPVVASAVGGITDQIVDGEHGVLLADPTDRDAFAGALRDLLLGDPARRERLGANARARVAEHFLVSSAITAYGRLLETLDV